jgi:hypothetical protein
MADRERITVELDSKVLEILRTRAAETGRTEGEILQRAFAASDLRRLMREIGSRSDLDDESAMQLVREELAAVRAERANRAA